jgi:hypothetical protein
VTVTTVLGVFEITQDIKDLKLRFGIDEFATAEITIEDAESNFFSRWGITGAEVFSIFIDSPMGTPAYHLNMIPVSYLPGKLEPRQVKIFLQSFAHYAEDSTFITKAFKGDVPIADIIENAFKRITDKNNQLYALIGFPSDAMVKNFVSPNWTPLQIYRYLRSIYESPSDPSTFYMFEDSFGVHFTTLAKGIAVKVANFKHLNVSLVEGKVTDTVTNEQSTNLDRILEDEYLGAFDHESNVEQDAANITLDWFDIDDKKVHRHRTALEDSTFAKLKTIGRHGTLNPAYGKISLNNYKVFNEKPSTAKARGWWHVQKGMLNAQVYAVTTLFDGKYSPMSPVYVTATTRHEGGTDKDQLRNGLWIVGAVEHTFHTYNKADGDPGHDECKSTVWLCRDSFGEISADFKQVRTLLAGKNENVFDTLTGAK